MPYFLTFSCALPGSHSASTYVQLYTCRTVRIRKDRSASVSRAGCSRSDPRELRSLSVAAKGETQRATYFRHAVGSEAGYALTQAQLRDGHGIVKIHGTGRLHAIFFIQSHFRGNASDRRGDGRHRRCRQVSKGAIAGQHDNRPGFVRRGKTVKPNIAPRYSSGQLASASQVDRLLKPFGVAS